MIDPRDRGTAQKGAASRRSRLIAFSLVAGVALVAAAACSSSSKTAASTTTVPSIAKGSGPVDVLYAGSLVNAMTNQIGKGFTAATGYSFSGTAGDSGTLANELKAKTVVGDVYISASPSKNLTLEGAANGNLVSWYAKWATSPLVLGYNPSSKFASDLKTKPWYQVLAEPGILVGLTPPATDPKGALAVQALTSAATTYNEPALATIATTTNDQYPETTLVGRLQAGQLDVGFFYAAEAAAAKPAIATVPLTGEDLAAMYTVTILNGAPHLAGAEAFIEYLLGPAAKPALTADGFKLITPPAVTGTGAPAALSSVLPA